MTTRLPENSSPEMFPVINIQCKPTATQFIGGIEADPSGGLAQAVPTSGLAWWKPLQTYTRETFISNRVRFWYSEGERSGLTLAENSVSGPIWQAITGAGMPASGLLVPKYSGAAGITGALTGISQFSGGNSRSMFIAYRSTSAGIRMVAGQDNSIGLGNGMGCWLIQTADDPYFGGVNSDADSGIARDGNTKAVGFVYRNGNTFDFVSTLGNHFINSSLPLALNTDSTAFQVGAEYAAIPLNPWIGWVGEILLYNRAVDATERATIMAYLTARYNGAA